MFSLDFLVSLRGFKVSSAELHLDSSKDNSGIFPLSSDFEARSRMDLRMKSWGLQTMRRFLFSKQIEHTLKVYSIFSSGFVWLVDIEVFPKVFLIFKFYFHSKKISPHLP